MTTTATSSAQRMVSRVKGVWRELDYAQRRLLEIRTGIPFTERRHGARAGRDDREVLSKLQ